MSERTKDILEWVYCIIIAIVLALLIKFFLGTPTVVKQKSMYPTLHPNDRLIISRWIRTTKKMPERGDIVTFEAPTIDTPDPASKEYEFDLNSPKAIYLDEPDNIFSKFNKYVLEIGKTSYIKRVIGLPGDHIEIKNDHGYINGNLYNEEYLDDSMKTDMKSGGICSDVIVPDGCVYVLGDNRNASIDSRKFGCIPVGKIEGKVVARWWPANKTGAVSEYSRDHYYKPQHQRYTGI